MNFEILPEGVKTFDYQDKLEYFYFELDKERGITYYSVLVFTKISHLIFS